MDEGEDARSSALWKNLSKYVVYSSCIMCWTTKSFKYPVGFDLFNSILGFPIFYGRRCLRARSGSQATRGEVKWPCALIKTHRILIK